MSHESFTAVLATIGIVIIVSSLLSGAVERTGLPLVVIFLLVGVALGPAGLRVVGLTLDSPALQVIGTLALLLVLFSDAIGVDIGEVRAQRRLALRILGPGTMIPALLMTLAGWLLLDLSLPAAAILGAALASTDPVLLRVLMRSPALPPAAKLPLRLESGMNDVILLPIVVLCMLALRPGIAAPAWEFGSHAVGLFLLGPMLGVLTGWIAITLLDQVRKRVGVRRDYESLYALGVAFTAYAAAEAVGGSGFLAAFAAGLVIAALDVELCDCFLDYGEASAEMFLLFTFVAFGAGLIWSGLPLAGDWRVLAFAAVALVARTVVLLPVLRGAGVDDRSRRLIALFGPRGLSSLLLVLLPVFAGVPGSERLFAITCLVVLLSVVIHGGGIALYLQRQGAQAGAAAGGRPAAGREGRGAGPGEGGAGTSRAAARPAAASHPAGPSRPAARAIAADGATVPEKITIQEFRDLHRSGEPVIVLDVRTERSYRDDPNIGVGAIRMPPDDAVRLARERRLDQHATLVLYCA
ncbi:MAG TPA: cation:proton antiporter [Gemmatimonadales bacterium]|jgi:NhaP-type Na+/H+ or K+/H+ antiporter|nr:cation:proton antiporter [Gemmatimonadales bacterium]